MRQDSKHVLLATILKTAAAITTAFLSVSSEIRNFQLIDQI